MPQVSFDQLQRWDQDYLDLAQWWASRRSKDPSSQVGAVVTDVRHSIKGMGYNGFPRGVVDSPERYQDRQHKLHMVVHAEVNALSDAGPKAAGGTLYVTPRAPCPSPCAGLAIQLGVARVVWRCPVDNRWNQLAVFSKQMFDEAGVKWYEVHE